ncbi:glutathione S-transferase family protein [Marivita geojedonensis]|uniref:Glutathione S-transferase n=1 Tax=Marivita geojedonensis TaxID=1123756 RepID=A0A1X4NLL6_9RHOB|nr:glutathione S-transferase family protein [Marivita geojedonensis]OSQ51153.1 glutathione S-transferase [Marivita geojedonensis]PRY78604.1 glutathione S-transferase [Marivita geojedonensis]
MSYVLHYALDNASLIVRLVLEELHLPYETALVDRRVSAQHRPAYQKLNPAGRIPALETPDGPMFETAAICLWLADRHRDRMLLSPAPDHPGRGRFLSWLFFLSNTVHAEMRALFYPDKYAGSDPRAQDALSKQLHRNLQAHFDVLNTAWRTVEGDLTFCDMYLAVLLRWPAIYPASADTSWYDLKRWSALHALARRIEARDTVARAMMAEGLGPTPFSAPHPPTPPEGSAL